VLDVAMHVTDKERHVTLILAINQLNAQVLLLQKVYYAPLHVSSTMC